MHVIYSKARTSEFKAKVASNTARIGGRRRHIWRVAHRCWYVYMHNESIQMYLNPRYWVICIASWKVFESSENSILAFIDNKLSCWNFFGICFPQQWLRVAYLIPETISEGSRSRGEIAVCVPMSIRRVGRNVFLFCAQSRCSVAH
jgi:hypothetical protein